MLNQILLRNILLIINKKIEKMAKSHSQKTDKFGLNWNNSEKLKKIYFDSIGRLSSKHPRQQEADVHLYHFWIYVK